VGKKDREMEGKDTRGEVEKNVRIDGERRPQAKRVVKKVELVVVNEKAGSSKDGKVVKRLEIA